MYPEWFVFGFWPVRSYGVALALSFLFGTLLARHRARCFGVEPRLILRVAVLALVATLVGARLAFVLVNPSEFQDNWWRVVLPLGDDGVLRLTGSFG